MIEFTKPLTIPPQALAHLGNYISCTGTELLFFDIETTGLSRERSFIYLIGCVGLRGEELILTQWMAENSTEEAQLLERFVSFSKSFRGFAHYNGKRFDIPFTEHRLLKYHMDSPFTGKVSLDLYLQLSLCRTLLKLEHMRQPDLEQFLYPDSHRTYRDGGACIPLYRAYCRRHKPETAEILLGHNREDLEGLLKILPALSYVRLLRGDFHAETAELTEEGLICRCRLHEALPKPVSFQKEDCFLSGEDFRLSFLLIPSLGRLKQHYEDYENYYYLPREDMAIHKSLAGCLEASLRIPATRQTCYTWVPCKEEFYKDLPSLENYLQKNLF